MKNSTWHNTYDNWHYTGKNGNLKQPNRRKVPKEKHRIPYSAKISIKNMNKDIFRQTKPKQTHCPHICAIRNATGNSSNKWESKPDGEIDLQKEMKSSEVIKIWLSIRLCFIFSS